MADEWYIEAVKFWGGLAGIGTAAFTLWDRALRHRPVVEPHAIAEADMVRMGLEEVGASSYLRITNPGDRAIVITSITYPTDDRITVRFHDSVFGIVAQKVGYQGVARIEGKAIRLFNLDLNSEVDKQMLCEKFNIWIHWRPITANLPRVPMRLQTSIASLMALSRDEWQVQQAESNRRGSG